MGATKQREIAVSQQVGRIVHGVVSRNFYRVQNYSCDMKMQSPCWQITRFTMWAGIPGTIYQQITLVYLLTASRKC